MLGDVNEVNILKPPPAFAGDARPRVGAAPDAPEPAPTPASEPTPPEPSPKRRRVYGDLFIVLGLTMLGGVLRFMFIDRPPLWGDDGFTFMRVCGTYQQMLDALQDWGFAPLHYELLWWIGRQTTLTPFYMRLVPAITGTLMVPAMYWFGRELVDRKVGLVAALFAATSAYLLNYSRDAKMYMPFWFFAALNFACLLWWLRTRGGVAWWSWVASGVAMLGLNMIGAVVLGIELAAVVLARRAYWTSLGKLLLLIPWVPVTLLNGTLRLVGAGPQERPPLDWWFNRAMSNFRWPPLALFVLGAAIMFVGPYGYYTHFNRYKEKIENRGGGLEAGGLGWINTYNRGRDALDLVAFTTTAHLYSWEWPRYDEKLRIDDAKEINPRALRWLKIAGVAILGVLALGLFPWPRAWTAFRPTEPAAPPRVWPWSRALAVVVLWIVVPAYAFYCASVPGFRSPLEVIANVALEDLARVDWPTVYDVAWWPFEGKGFWAKLSVAWPAFASQFAPSNLRRPTGALQWAMLVTAALGALAALYFSGRSVRERAYKLTILVTIALAVYVLCWFVYLLYVQKYRGSVWMPRYLGFAWPALALAVAVLLLRLPTRPLRWAAVALLVGVNLSVFGARLFA